MHYLISYKSRKKDETRFSKFRHYLPMVKRDHKLTYQEIINLVNQYSAGYFVETTIQISEIDPAKSFG